MLQYPFSILEHSFMGLLLKWECPDFWHVSYLILADGVLFQQVLITATNFEDVFTLIFLNTHLELLWGQQHAACLLTNGLCYHL